MFEHIKKDDWCDGNFIVEYIHIEYSRTDLEYLEAHFISLYNTVEYYNIAKTNWGTSQFIDIKETDWTKCDEKMYYDPIFYACELANYMIEQENTFDLRMELYGKKESDDFEVSSYFKCLCEHLKGAIRYYLLGSTDSNIYVDLFCQELEFYIGYHSYLSIVFSYLPATKEIKIGHDRDRIDIEVFKLQIAKFGKILNSLKIA